MNAPWPLPAVADSLLCDFDLFAVEPIEGDIHRGWSRLHEGPDIFYTPLNGGHWVATRAEHIHAISRDHDRFSNSGVALLREASGPRFIPGEVDPPLHGAFRTALNPEFSPRRIRELTEAARAVAVEIIEPLAKAGACEFRDAVALRMPIYNFLSMMKLPREDAEMLTGHADIVARSNDPSAFTGAIGALHAYIDALITARIADPRDDFLSHLLTATPEDRPITREEVQVTMLNVLLGGLDTVTASMNFFMNFLAQHPAHRQALASDPSHIPQAIEELLRRHAVFNIGRLVREDMEFAGLPFRKNDLVLIPGVLHNLDPHKFEDPLTVDFSRAEKGHHLTFGMGVHRCLGSNFARVQLAMMLEEWIARIPEFILKPGTVADARSGRVNGIHALHLNW